MKQISESYKKRLVELSGINSISDFFKSKRKTSLTVLGNKQVNGVVAYIRFGLPNTDQKGSFQNSYRYFDGKKAYTEGGISVFESIYDGKNFYVFTHGTALRSSFDELIISDKKIYLIDGELSNNEGSDGELLMKSNGFKVICEIPKNIIIKSN